MIFRHAWHIFCKDVLLEWRSKQTITSMLIFALMVVVMFAFAFQPTREITRAVFPGMAWAAFTFAGILGLNRAFLSEKQQDCITGLILAPMDPTAIYFGKVLGTMFLMGCMELIALPLFFVLFDFRLQGAPAMLLLVIFLGTLGFATVGTFLAALAANSRSSELLLPLILFPIIVPVLIASVKATGLVLSGSGEPADVMTWLRLLGVYDLVFLVVPFLLFEFVLEV